MYGSPYVHLKCSLHGFTKPKFINNFTPLRWQTVLGGLGKTSWLAGTSLECIRIVIEPNWNVMYIMSVGLWVSNFAQTQPEINGLCCGQNLADIARNKWVMGLKFCIEMAKIMGYGMNFSQTCQEINGLWGQNFAQKLIWSENKVEQ